MVVFARMSLLMESESKHLNERAEQLMKARRWNDAIELIESAPLLFESDPELLWNLGWAYFQLEDFKTAQIHLSRACTLKPTMAVAWWALGTAQMEDGNLEEAETNVKKALAMLDRTIVRQILALILMKRGNFDEAEQVHLTGLELKPESPERWDIYGCFLEDCGRQNEAEVAYEKARLFGAGSTGNK